MLLVATQLSNIIELYADGNNNITDVSHLTKLRTLEDENYFIE